MIDPRTNAVMEALFCCNKCVRPMNREKDLIDDGSFNYCTPVRIGKSILLCGRRKSYFPFQCLIGADWPIVLLVYCLICGANGIVLGTMAWQMGWPILLIGGTSCALLLFFYSMTVCSDPGIIYKNDFETGTELNRLNVSNENPNDDIEKFNRNSKDSNNKDGIAIRNNSNGSISDSPNSSSSGIGLLPVPKEPTIECGHCNLQRPTYARHCSYCGVCIENLDHHCPWSGKCIGKRNMFAFTCFVSLLCFQVYFLLGTLVYYFIAFYSGGNLPKGKGLH